MLKWYGEQDDGGVVEEVVVVLSLNCSETDDSFKFSKLTKYENTYKTK